MPGADSELPLRDRVLDEIRNHPGASARELQRGLGAAWGETAYHLERLVQRGEVRRERGGWRDYYFPLDLTWADRRALQALRSPAERTLMLAILEHPGRTFTELVDLTGLGRSTVSFHLGRLGELGQIAPGEGSDRRLVAVDPERTRRLLTTYAESFSDRLVDRFVDAFGGLLKE
jgi:predicted transcriptional regulator